MAVNIMLNLIDFKHLQTILLSIAYARIKTFSSIAGRYFDDKNIRHPTFWHTWCKLSLKRCYFAAIGLPSMKMVADRHRHAAYHNKHWRRAS